MRAAVVPIPGTKSRHAIWLRRVLGAGVAAAALASMAVLGGNGSRRGRTPNSQQDLQGRRALTIDTLNPRLRNMEYAVRGAVPSRAEEIAGEIAAAAAGGEPNPYNFSRLLPCNIGNPHAVGQAPITFYRQVLSLVDSPTLLAAAKASKLRGVYPTDVVERAATLASAISGGTGAYTHSQGLPLVRRHVCDFIEARDSGPPCEPSNIFLLNGASAGIQSVMTALIARPEDAILVPVPQYPIYSALIALLGGSQVSYFLDEQNGWGLSVDELQRAVSEARAKGLNPRALVLINPGNPTGQVLSPEGVRAVAQFCAEQRLVLLADEVYQENVYAAGRHFVSARSVVTSGGSEFEDLELVSFHSTSKGLIGECGRRGGYMELWNIDPQVKAQLYKLQSSQLCPNVDGQVMTDLMVRPPQPGDASYDLFAAESGAIYAALRRKAEALVSTLNSIDGVYSNLAEGAMYAFVSLELPPKAVEAARKLKMAPDQMYCLSLLEATGIVTVPGSGFGQKAGSWHFRITFLPPEDELYRALSAFKAHHEDFVKRYS